MNTSEEFKHRAVVTSDEEFLQSLTDYLSTPGESIKPSAPVFYKADGTIDREKTLGLPYYSGFKQ